VVAHRDEGMSFEKLRPTRAGALGLGILLLFTLLLQGCGAEDISFNLKLRNNTHETAVVLVCNGRTSCTRIAYKVALKPGAVVLTAQYPDGITRPMRIDSEFGRILGCLPFQFSRVVPSKVVVNVSQMVPCGDSLGTRKTEGRDWPYHSY